MADPYYPLSTFSARTSLGYLMKRVQRLTHAQFDAAFEDGEFTFTQWVVLGLLHSDVADTNSGLARDIGHDNGAMTRVVDQLVQRGLIERQPDVSDRRVIKLALTDDGSAALMRITPRVVDIWNMLLEDFPRGDVDRFIAMLVAMEDKLVRMDAERGATGHGEQTDA